MPVASTAAPDPIMSDKPLNQRRFRRVRKAFGERFPGLRTRLIDLTAHGTAAAIRRRAARVDWTREGRAHVDAALARGPVVLVCWHESLPIAPFFMRDLPVPVTSIHAPSPAGRIGEVHAIALGLTPEVVHKGWTPRDLLRRVRQGGVAALAVDGPSGPARVAKPAALDWARATGAELVLFAAGTDRGRRLPSWDRMIWPSGRRGIASFAPGPTATGRGAAARDAARQDLQAMLTRHADDVQRRAGMTRTP